MRRRHEPWFGSVLSNIPTAAGTHFILEIMQTIVRFCFCVWNEFCQVVDQHVGAFFPQNHESPEPAARATPEAAEDTLEECLDALSGEKKKKQKKMEPLDGAKRMAPHQGAGSWNGSSQGWAVWTEPD